jgi:hypothetical protein
MTLPTSPCNSTVLNELREVRATDQAIRGADPRPLAPGGLPDGRAMPAVAAREQA